MRLVSKVLVRGIVCASANLLSYILAAISSEGLSSRLDASELEGSRHATVLLRRLLHVLVEACEHLRPSSLDHRLVVLL